MEVRRMLSRIALAAALCLTFAAPAVAGERPWIPAWYASPEPSATDKAFVQDQTLRQIVRVSAGGTSVRVRLSNAYGTAPLRLDDIRLARRDTGSRIDTTSDVAVTFNGRSDVTTPPGAYVLSDPLPVAVTPDSDLAVSIYVSAQTPLTTVHDIQRGVLYVAPGRQTSAAELPVAGVDLGVGRAFPWLAEIEVSGSTARGVLFTFGDSITDGYGIDPDAGKTWPDLLSRRLHDANIPLSVVNAAISGNRLLHHGQWGRFGEGGLARFDRDVLAQPNASAVVILLGINDLGHAQGPGSWEYVSADDMIDGLAQLAARAHDRGLRVYAATLTPFKGTVFKDYYSDEKEARRQAINAWIRKTPALDGVFDFEKVVEDPANPGQMLPAYDLGDHLHPNAAGDAAMANAIPLSPFTWAKKLPK
ncbi:MAG: SGNH/GDSL hydrolase family protein [Asticcacaulis sp.]|nr:SGNH/GDSL hydrolase family protein [Asticcacaulis sp.]